MINQINHVPVFYVNAAPKILLEVLHCDDRAAYNRGWEKWEFLPVKNIIQENNNMAAWEARKNIFQQTNFKSFTLGGRKADTSHDIL